MVGTFRLLEAARAYCDSLGAADQAAFRFLHVSTDEVYGSLAADEPAFTETSRYQPNSPYSATKAASDHLVRAWCHTYALPVLITNCSNNYGPYQFPEKLIPLMIHQRAARRAAAGLWRRPATCAIGSTSTITARAIRACSRAGASARPTTSAGAARRPTSRSSKPCATSSTPSGPRQGGGSYRQQIEFVADRPGHDHRYAMDTAKIERELGWTPAESFATGIAKTVRWYLDHAQWVERFVSGS